ncbi:MAG: type II toxin-antitoxin system MqsA family antitoxin [Acidobacteria bacterium]|nr:type II toxin-antitoxin system MqsA family antitoxin [Acidobacteriota bacterium]
MGDWAQIGAAAARHRSAKNSLISYDPSGHVRPAYRKPDTGGAARSERRRKRLSRGGQPCRSVPADVCDNCGEYYLSSEVAGQVMDKAQAAVSSGAEVEIVKFAA